MAAMAKNNLVQPQDAFFKNTAIGCTVAGACVAASGVYICASGAGSDGRGTFSVKEAAGFAWLLTENGEVDDAKVDKVLKAADLDGDGRLSLDEVAMAIGNYMKKHEDDLT